MEEITKKKLQAIACKVRMGVIEGTYCAKSGHPGGSLSISDLLTYLYFAKMHIDPKQPEMADRDRLVLSKGHCAPALYATLAQRGFFPQEELQSLRHIGAMLQGHPCIHTPGIDMSSGSLGQGISVACGMALADKLDSEGVEKWYRCFFYNMKLEMEAYYRHKAILNRIVGGSMEVDNDEIDED